MIIRHWKKGEKKVKTSKGEDEGNDLNDDDVNDDADFDNSCELKGTM